MCGACRLCFPFIFDIFDAQQPREIYLIAFIMNSFTSFSCRYFYFLFLFTKLRALRNVSLLKIAIDGTLSRQNKILLKLLRIFFLLLALTRLFIAIYNSPNSKFFSAENYFKKPLMMRTRTKISSALERFNATTNSKLN
jgi:hypothetical protein